jgi:hypothetical protein
MPAGFSDSINCFVNSPSCCACQLWSSSSVSHNFEYHLPHFPELIHPTTPPRYHRARFVLTPDSISSQTVALIQLLLFIDRRYIFIQQAGCIPQHLALAVSVDRPAHLASPVQSCLSGLPWYFFIGHLCMRKATNGRPGLVIYSIWIPRRERRVASTSQETMTLSHFLRIYISLFVGIVCTSSVSLFLLVWIVNDSNVSVDSLHRDFQTVYILTTDQWSRNPQLRTASRIAVALGIFGHRTRHRFIPERKSQPTSSLALKISRVGSSLFSDHSHINVHDRVRHRSISNVLCHGSLPVYIPRSSSSYSEAPAIPSLVRQSTLAPTFGSRVTSVEHQQPEVPPQISGRDTQSSLSQPCDSETIRPNAPSETEETLRPCNPLQPSRSSQQTERVRNPTASTLTLTDSTYLVSSFGEASSTHRTREEGSIRR